MDKFFVIVNNAVKGSWSEYIWKDVEKIGRVYLDSSTLQRGSLLWRLKKLHFSNKINRKIRVPLKSIWNHSLCIQPDQLKAVDRNYIIFQSNVKFPPSYISKLKKEKNVCVILYLPDTISSLGIGNSKWEFDEYCSYYHIDYAFTFDFKESKMLAIPYFDVYSSLQGEQLKNIAHPQKGIFYIGNCRSKERLNMLHAIYRKCRNIVKCDFYIVGVDAEDCLYPKDINYNQTLSYSEVLRKISNYNTILEVTNPGQTGFTLRFKEAVCNNKKLLTNNQQVQESKYYKSKNIRLFNIVNDIDPLWINNQPVQNYYYTGEFSPIILAKKIIEQDLNREKDR